MPRHVDASRDIYFLIVFSPNEQRARGGGGEGDALPNFFLFSFFFPVQQTTGGIGHRVK